MGRTKWKSNSAGRRKASANVATRQAEGQAIVQLAIIWKTDVPPKVDTTGVSQTSNPVRFGQDFQGRIANPREVLVFHRSRKTAGKSAKVVIDQPELSIDDPDLTVSEKLAKVRVGTLVKEYLSAQELQLLGEHGMSDAIQIFVDKDDTHAIET